MSRLQSPDTEIAFLKLGYCFEGSLIGVAFILGWFADLNPLADFAFNESALIWGILGTIPLFLLFLVFYRYPIGPLYEIKRSLIVILGPFLASSRWYHLVFLAALAGISEEILFRGFFQPWLELKWGYLGGLLGSNLIFGLLHWITPMYALLAGLIGIYLGQMLDVSESRNLLIPIFIHALYDYLAFLVVASSCRLKDKQS